VEESLGAEGVKEQAAEEGFFLPRRELRRGRADAARGTGGGREARGADPSQGSGGWAADPSRAADPRDRRHGRTGFFLHFILLVVSRETPSIQNFGIHFPFLHLFH
jgi:hypothetical protein